MTTTTIQPSNPSTAALSVRRLYALRAGYLLMGLGLVLVKWPLLPEASTLDPAMTDVVANCSLVVVIIAVIPWRHVWTRYVLSPADPWR